MGGPTSPTLSTASSPRRTTWSPPASPTAPTASSSALYAYNHADWYVGDVLHYAHAYGGGDVLGTTTDCGPGTGTGDPTLPPLADERLQTVLAWAAGKKGLPYTVGGVGPGSFDCSGFVMVAYSQIGISLPRTAEDQRDWLAAGNGYRVPSGQERPGDLVFTDTYLGPIPDRPRPNRVGPRRQDHHRSDGQPVGRHHRPLRRPVPPRHPRDLARRQHRRPTHHH